MSSSNNDSRDTTNLPAFTNIFRQATISSTKPKPIPETHSYKNNNTSNNNNNKYNPNRQSRMITNPHENFDNFYLNPKHLEDEMYTEQNYDSPIKLKNKVTSPSTNSYYHRRQNSYDGVANSNSHRNNSNSPLSKTPDSSTDIGNWIDVPDSGIGGGGSSGIGGGGSVGTIGDSDHEMIESNNQSINHDDKLENDWVEEELDSPQNVIVSHSNDHSSQSKQPAEDNTTRRLKTFVATTLHNEQAYLDKITKLLTFRNYLEENFNGSLTDINVLFADIHQIYKSHEVVCIKLQDFLNSFSDLSQPHINNNSSNLLIKETFLSSALQLLANITMASFPVYLEFVENYPRSMSLLGKLEKNNTGLASGLLNLSKRKSFLDCQTDFGNKVLNGRGGKEKGKSYFFNFNKRREAFNAGDEFNLYYNDSKLNEKEQIDVGKLFAEEILHRPTKLFLFIHSLKDECLRAAQELPVKSSNGLKSNIKSMFDNEESKSLRDKIFEQIKLNIMPKEARKHEDVVELHEGSNERKLRHLILYGDCLVCCRLKKDKRQLKWFIPIDKLEIYLDDYKSAKSETELKSLRSELVQLREQVNKEQNSSTRNQMKIKKKLAEHENELTLQSSRLKLIIRANPYLSYSASTISSFATGVRSNLFNSHLTSIGNSMTNVSLSGHGSFNGFSANMAGSTHNLSAPQNSNSSNSSSSINSQYVFLFTSDYERIAWVEELNSVIFAYKTRRTPITIQQSDIECRINAIKKQEEPPKALSSTCTGSLELLIKQIDNLQRPNSNLY